MPIAARVNSSAVAILTFVTSICFTTPAARAALTVGISNVAGTAEAVAAGQADANSTAAGPNPRRTSRARNRPRARSRRLFSVALVNPRTTAASSCALPCR